MLFSARFEFDSVIYCYFCSFWVSFILEDFVLGCAWGNEGHGRGLVTFQSLSTIKKGTSHSNFQSNEPFLKFIRQGVLKKP